MLKWLKSVMAPASDAAKPIENAAAISHEARSNCEQWRQRGNQYLDQNNVIEAENCYRKGLSFNNEDVPCLVNLGFILASSNSKEAQDLFLRAIELEPNNVDALFSLGNLHKQRKAYREAISCYQKALALQPSFDFCRKELCETHVLAGNPVLAITSFMERPFFAVNSFEYHAFKAHLHLQADQAEPALQEFQAAGKLQATNLNIQLQIACLYLRKKNFDQARKLLEQILQADPKHSEALSFLAAANQLQGKTASAITYYRKALELDPKNLTTHQNLLYALSYDEQCTPAAYLDEAKAFAVKLRTGVVTLPQQQQALRIEKTPLRIGFVSGDLRGHPVGLFLESVLTEMSRTHFQCIAYANYPVEDANSVRLKKLFHTWHVISSLSDDELSAKIQSDHIDILIDLAGHTERNRLAVFCRKPAPVQVAWLGYWASTGLSEIDYILVDDNSIEDGDEVHFSEKPYRLPGSRLCMSAPQTTRPLLPGPCPAFNKGYFTFGSFQVMSKINSSTLQLWAQVMKAVPRARLRLQNAAFDHADARIEFQTKLKNEEFDLDRIDLHGSMSYTDYLAAHAEVDIILDTHPFPGGTTTAEAIWMGVPTLSLHGRDLLSRQGQSMLTCVGLADWVAKDREEFVALAIKKSEDLEILNQTRLTLRGRALASPLFDASQFAKNLTTAFTEMWQEKART